MGINQRYLTDIKIPGSIAQGILNFGKESFSWEGRVDRSLGFINERERLARVVVRVENPYSMKDPKKPALSIGSFVEVIITGRKLENVYPIPRHALRDGSKVWIAKPDSTLGIREVIISALTRDEAVIESGIAEGERIIVSSISGAAPGLKLRLREVEDSR